MTKIKLNRHGAISQKRLDKFSNWVMANLDFKKIQRCMGALDWRWVTSKDRSAPPTISEMKITVQSLIQNMKSSDVFDSAAGGFRVWRDQRQDLSIAFCVDDWDEEESHL